MSMMLAPFHDRAWAAVQSALAANRRADAQRLLHNLLARPDLSAAMTADAHRCLAAVALHADRHARARKHLRAATAIQPNAADLYHQLGIAFETDPYGCDTRAMKCHRRAVRLAPDNAIYHAAYGRAAIRVHADRRGFRALRTAIALAPTDTEVLGVVLEAYRDAGRVRAGWTVVSQARFLAPKCSAIRTLWERAKFDLACVQQRGTPHNARPTPAVLPFVRLIDAHGGSHRIRFDTASRSGPHFGANGF